MGEPFYSTFPEPGATVENILDKRDIYRFIVDFQPYW